MNRYHQKIALLTLLAIIQISHADNLSTTLSTSQNLTNALQLQSPNDSQSEILALNESNHSIPIHHSLDVIFTSVDLYADYGTINYLTSNHIYTNYLDSNYNYSYIAQSNQAYIDYLNAYSSDIDYLNAYSSDIFYLNAYTSEIAYLNSDDIYSDYITSSNASISNLWAYETYSNHLYTTYEMLINYIVMRCTPIHCNLVILMRTQQI